jgi:hypothetical protein
MQGMLRRKAVDLLPAGTSGMEEEAPSMWLLSPGASQTGGRGSPPTVGSGPWSLESVLCFGHLESEVTLGHPEAFSRGQQEWELELQI